MAATSLEVTRAGKPGPERASVSTATQLARLKCTGGLNEPSLFSPLLIALTSVAIPAQTSRTATSYFNRARLHYAQGDLDAAIDDFDIAITFDSRYAAAFCNRGAARFAKGDLDAAIADYDKAIELILALPRSTTTGEARVMQKERWKAHWPITGEQLR